jgi:hypothetical protein
VPGSSLANRCLEAFFNRAWPMPVCSFLHRPTVMEHHRNGCLDQALFLALVGIATVVADLGGGTRDQGAEGIESAESLVLESLDKPTLSMIQATVLIIQYRLMSRKFGKVFMLAALAARSALALRLNYEHPSAPFLTRESCRRTVWALYMMDTNLAAGYSDFTLWTTDLINIQLPCEDHSFIMNTPQETPRLEAGQAATNLSLLAHTVCVLNLRHRVLKFSKQVASNSSALDQDVEGQVRDFANELNDFVCNLPKQYQSSEYALHLHAHLPTLAQYLKLHITWFGVCCILYRLAFVELTEGLPSSVRIWLDSDFLLDCQMRCFKSAVSMAEFLGSVLNLGIDLVCLDVDAAVSTYQCARLLICVQRNNIIDASTESVAKSLTQCQALVESGLFCRCDAVDAIVGNPYRDVVIMLMRAEERLERSNQ